MLEFFIEAQSRVTALQQQQFSILEIRAESERALLRTPASAPVLSEFVKKNEFLQIPECVLDAEFRGLLSATTVQVVHAAHTAHTAVAPAQNSMPNSDPETQVLESFATTVESSSACAAALLLPPGFWLRQNWSASEEPFLLEYAALLKSRNALFLRTGFLSSEFEIHESVLMGFRGVALQAALLDEFQIQFLTEVGRDYKTCLVWAVESEETLKRVLKTDAPYLGIVALPNEKGERNLGLLQRLAPKIPNTCLKIAFLPGAKAHEINYARAAGFVCVVGSS